MSNKISLSRDMRIIHRYLGFFLAGIMAMYSVSGIVLIFRNTDFLKKEKIEEKIIDKHIPVEELGSRAKIKGFKLEKTEGGIIYFKGGTYNSTSGELKRKVKSLPLVLDKMTKIHKATSDSPLYFLNIFFGVSLFFFVVSSFWMFRPKTQIFKTGMYYTIGGIVLTLIMLFV